MPTVFAFSTSLLFIQIYSHSLFYIYTRLFAFGVPFLVENEDDMPLDDVIDRMRSQADLAAYGAVGTDDDDGDFSSYE
jgi:hypothetical protein